MRNPVLPTTAIALCVALAACNRGREEAQAPVDPGSPEYCAVAEAYLKDRLNRLADKKSVLVTANPPVASAIGGVPVAKLIQPYDLTRADPAGWPKDPPALDLATKWRAAPMSNALTACQGLEPIVSAAGVELAPAQPGGMFQRRDPRPHLAFSLPVVSDSGDAAMLVETSHLPGELGAVAVIHLRKDAGGAWREVDFRAFVPGFELPEIPDAPPPVPPPPAKK